MEYASNFFKLLNHKNEFGFGFFVFGFCSQAFGVLFGVFLMFGLGFKYFFNFGGKKTSDLANGVSSKYRLVGLCNQKIVSCKRVHTPKVQNTSDDKANYAEEYSDGNGGGDDEDEECEEEQCCCSEDEEFNVMALRKMVKIERGQVRKVKWELEKERMAAASAAEEAMAMIMRLQSEKSCAKMEANQYRRMAEQRQEYNDGIIQSLQWILAKREEEVSILKDELSLCWKKLEIFMKGSALKDGLEEFHMSSTLEECQSSLDNLGTRLHQFSSASALYTGIFSLSPFLLCLLSKKLQTAISFRLEVRRVAGLPAPNPSLGIELR